MTDASTTITNEEFIAGIKGISEGKTSSQSGRHYSMYKALVAFPFTTQIIVKLISTSVENNIIINRWKKVLQIMLCKVPGNYSIEKMRVINLIEADINMFFRLIWGKKFVNNIIKHNQFIPEQMGNRPGYQCSSAVLSKVLSFDTIRLLRLPATIFNNDATACYDRIIPFLSLLCCQHFGLSSKAADFMLNFLKNAEYHIRTCYGISEEFYNNYMQAIFGVLQGSGSAPSIWFAMSLIMIKTYKEKFRSTSIPNPTNDISLQKVIDAFVDDADLWDILPSQTTTKELLQRLETRAQYWEKLLHSAGGKLNFTKCFWYVIQWKWDDNGTPSMMNNDELPASLTLTNGNHNQPSSMKRKSPFEALKTLGVMTSPSGSNTEQFHTVKMYLHYLVLEIKSKILTHLEASLIIPVYIHSKLCYILAATNFTKSECDQLDRIFRATILSKMGINKATNVSIIHASHRYGGLQIPTCWDIQGSQHLHLLLGHIQLDDTVGKQLLLTMDYLYIHLGLHEQVMTYDYKHIQKFIENSWIANTWSYASSVETTIHSRTLQIPLQRENDSPIMAPAIKYLSTTKFKRINAVRLFLKLFYISDMSTSSGKNIAQEYLYRSKSRHRTNTLNWPYQLCPGKAAWKEWRAYVNKYFTCGKQKLIQPLGKWTNNTPRTQIWDTQIDPRNDIIYIKSDDTFHKYRFLPRSRHRIECFGQVNTLPANLIPITIIDLTILPRTDTYALEISTVITTPPKVTTFTQYLQQLPTHERIIIGSLPHIQHWELLNIIDMLASNTYAIGSDGSVRGKSASYGTCIQSTTIPEVFIQSCAQLMSHSSFTAESYGYLSALYLLRALLSFFDITQDRHTVATFLDNKGLLQRLQYDLEISIKHCQYKGAAIIREIKAVEASLNLKFLRQHVKSHVYDKETNFHKIPLPHRINKRSDIIANTAYNKHFRQQSNNTLLPTTKIYIKHQEQIYTDEVRKRFQFLTHDITLQQYILDKQNWTETQFHSINWDYLSNTFYRSTTNQKKAYMKITHRKWATNEMKSKWSNRNDHRCMRCMNLHEDWEHIFQCNSRHSTDSITRVLHDLKHFLASSKTSKIFQQIFISGLTSWMHKETAQFPLHSQQYDDAIFSLLHQAFQQQSSIGWDQLLRGRICNTWFLAHDMYVSQRMFEQQYSSKVFGPRLVQHLLQLSLKTWTHRNEFYFGVDVQDTEKKLKIKASKEITTAYNQQDLVPVQDRPLLFSRSLSEILALPLKAQTNWLQLYKIATDSPPISPHPIPEPPDQLNSSHSSPLIANSLHKFFHRFIPQYQAFSKH